MSCLLLDQNAIVGAYDRMASQKNEGSPLQQKNDNYGLCHPFIVRADADYDVVLCQNGDGLLVGSEKNQSEGSAMRSLTTLDTHSVALLRYLLNSIRQEHIIPVVVFAPWRSAKLTYDLTRIKQALANEVIIVDLTHYPISKTNWADATHLNAKGREIYTTLLAGQLTKLTNDGSALRQHANL